MSGHVGERRVVRSGRDCAFARARVVSAPRYAGAATRLHPEAKGGRMESFAFAFPVLPGKAEEARLWGKEVTGPRSSEMDASRRPLGVTREAVWLQQTPQGDMCVVVLEGGNVADANRRFAAS